MFKSLVLVSFLQYVQCQFSALDSTVLSKYSITNAFGKYPSFEQSIGRIAQSDASVVSSSITDIMLKPNVISTMSANGFVRVDFYGTANCGGAKTFSSGIRSNYCQDTGSNTSLKITFNNNACGNAQYFYYSDSVCGTLDQTVPIPTTCTSIENDDNIYMRSMKIGCSTGSNPTVDSNTLFISAYADTTTCSGSPVQFVAYPKDFCLAEHSDESLLIECSTSAGTATITSYSDTNNCSSPSPDDSSTVSVPLGCINPQDVNGGGSINDQNDDNNMSPIASAKVVCGSGTTPKPSPTKQPVSAAPSTLYPTFVAYVPKTAAPTTEGFTYPPTVANIVSFDVAQTINGVSYSAYLTDMETYNLAIKLAILQTMSATPGLDVDNIRNFTVTDGNAPTNSALQAAAGFGFGAKASHAAEHQAKSVQMIATELDFKYQVVSDSNTEAAENAVRYGFVNDNQEHTAAATGAAAHLRRHLAATDSINTAYTVFVNAAGVAEEALTSQMDQAVNDGSYNAYLGAYGQQYNLNGLVGASVATPNSNNDDDTDHTGLIIGTVIGGTVFLCLLCGLGFFCCGGGGEKSSADGKEGANGKNGKHEMVQKSDHENVDSGKQKQAVSASAPPSRV